MNQDIRDITNGVWNELRGLLKKGWGALTGDRNTAVDGRLQWLSGMIQVHNGLHMVEVRREVQAFLRRAKHRSDLY